MSPASTLAAKWPLISSLQQSSFSLGDCQARVVGGQRKLSQRILSAVPENARDAIRDCITAVAPVNACVSNLKEVLRMRRHTQKKARSKRR
jgi:hypothetical protein